MFFLSLFFALGVKKLALVSSPTLSLFSSLDLDEQQEVLKRLECRLEKSPKMKDMLHLMSL